MFPFPLKLVLSQLRDRRRTEERWRRALKQQTVEGVTDLGRRLDASNRRIPEVRTAMRNDWERYLILALKNPNHRCGYTGLRSAAWRNGKAYGKAEKQRYERCEHRMQVLSD